MEKARLIKKDAASAQPTRRKSKKKQPVKLVFKQWVENKQTSQANAQSEARAAFHALFAN